MTLIRLGEVFGEKSLLTDPEILDRYGRSGPACARDMDGSFVLIFLAGDGAGTTTVITDPLNSLKCFIEEMPDSFLLASSLNFLPIRPRELDRIALTSFLVNGVILNHRTIFEEVRSLDRASIHTFNGQGTFSSTSYWRYQFDHAYASRPRGELRDELAVLLHQAAAKRIRPDETVYLSLSGGYDSTCVLGLLARHRPARLECFSYLTGSDPAGSDETVAAQMARIAGFPHQVFSSFRHDLPDLIRRNARLGEARANFCGELDAWEELQRQLPPDAVLFVGDECFGWTDCRLKSDADLLASIPIYPAAALGAYADGLDLASLGNGYDLEIARIVDAARLPDLHDTKDFLYLDQRLGNVILPWRELFVGRASPVRNLLIDRNVINFMSHLPSPLRRGKKLYKETVRQMFPELFRVRRAFQPTTDYLAEGLHRDHRLIRAELLGGSSRLDPWLRREACAQWAERPPPVRSWKARLVIFGKKLLKENPLAHSFRGLFAPRPATRIGTSALLLRILTLREYLR